MIGMTRVSCPQCQRWLELPPAQVGKTAQCPSCNAVFAAAVQVVSNKPKKRHRNESNSVKGPSTSNPDWRLAKYTFVLALVVRCLIAGLTSRNLDEFLTQSIIAPVFAAAATAMAILMKGVFFGWGQESSLPGTRALLWLFIAGLIMGAGIGAGLAALADNATRGSIATAALLVSLLGGFGLLLTGMWCIVIIGFLRELPGKIAKASQPDAKLDEPKSQP